MATGFKIFVEKQWFWRGFGEVNLYCEWTVKDSMI